MKCLIKLMLMTTCLLFISTLVFANDPAKEYSTTQNPNGIWSYGYSLKLGSPFILYTAWRINGWNPRDDYWYNPNGPGVPVVERDLTENYTTPDRCGFVVPDTLVPYPGSNGEYSIVRWTAPFAGTYNIRGYFQGNQSLGCSYGDTKADVHVLWNSSTSLFDSIITRFGQVGFFDLMQQMNASDTLDLAAGPDGYVDGKVADGTNLQLTIDFVPVVQMQTGKTQGRISVAILSSSSVNSWSFNAPSMVDRNSVTFGRIGSEPSMMHNPDPVCTTPDINGDGVPDLVCDFDSQMAAFLPGDSQAVLQGMTKSGITLRAIVPYTPHTN